jgi:hypothetical protein
MDSPYKTTFTSASPTLGMDVSSQIDRYKEEEQFQKAPPIQPFTLDNTKELLSGIYEKLSILRKAIDYTMTQPKVDRAALAEINRIIENIGKEILMDIPEQIDKLNL